MFDTTHQHIGPRVLESHSVVHEHRAATDESVRLLQEMQKSARDAVIMGGNIGNDLNGKWAIFTDCARLQVIYKCRFFLNGKDHSFEVTLNQALSRDQLIRRLGDAVLKEVARCLCLQLVDEHKGFIA